MVGLPPDGGWSLSWRVLERERLGAVRLEPMPFPWVREDAELGVVPAERYELDGAVYDSFRPPDPVFAEEEAWMPGSGRLGRSLSIFYLDHRSRRSRGRLVGHSHRGGAEQGYITGCDRQHSTQHSHHPNRPILDHNFGDK